MHGHCVHRLDIVESARQNKTHATLAVVARKGDTQYVLACLGPLALRQFERNANVAVHQAQAVVVASHQHRPAFVPLLIAVDQPGLEQGVSDSLIQAFDTPRPFAYSAQQLEGIEGLQHLPRPLSPAFVIKGAVNGWSLVAQQTQVMPITWWSVVMAVQQQTLQRFVLFTFERQGKHVFVVTFGQQLASFIGLLLIDPTRQLTNAAALAKST